MCGASSVVCQSILEPESYRGGDVPEAGLVEDFGGHHVVDIVSVDGNVFIGEFGVSGRYIEEEGTVG